MRDKAEIMGDGEHRYPVGQLLENLEELELNAGIDVGGGFKCRD